MANIILYTNQISIRNYWSNALNVRYDYLHVDNEDKLKTSIANTDIKTILMLDETSVTDIKKCLEELRKSSHVDILIFNNKPDVKHAITLIKNNVKAYENSFLHQSNLLKMLASIQSGRRWFFPDLTQYIVNAFVDNKTDEDVDYLSKLTQKEKKIASMVVAGMTNKEIASKEKIVLSTVKGHLQKIFEKLQVSDRVALILKLR